MKYDIILAGVGGQGVLSIAAILGVAAVESGMHLKQAEVHGLSQRGGAVQSHFRISDQPIFSDLIAEGRADMVLSMEPMEALRYLPFLNAQGVIVAELSPFVNISNYPEMDTIEASLRALPRVHLVDAVRVAKELRITRSSNMILLGAASHFVPLGPGQLETAIGEVFGRKGAKVVEQNVMAFQKGRELVEAAGSA